MSEAMLYDKNLRPIMPHDVLKVFHFTGARGKKHYMYKQALNVVKVGPRLVPYLVISHLTADGENYRLLLNNKVLPSYEIVQGFDDYGNSFEDRVKRVE